MQVDFLPNSPVQIRAGGHRTPQKPVPLYFIISASWSAEICWYYMPIVTAAIPVVIRATGTGAPALRAKPAEACNQAFWYRLVQSHPVESKHRWRPVIHVHR